MTGRPTNWLQLIACCAATSAVVVTVAFIWFVVFSDMRPVDLAALWGTGTAVMLAAFLGSRRPYTHGKRHQ